MLGFDEGIAVVGDVEGEIEGGGVGLPDGDNLGCGLKEDTNDLVHIWYDKWNMSADMY